MFLKGEGGSKPTRADAGGELIQTMIGHGYLHTTYKYFAFQKHSTGVTRAAKGHLPNLVIEVRALPENI